MSYEALARRSERLVEPFVAMVYYVPEVYNRLKAIGLDGRPGYFCSRSAAMGRVPAIMVAATFYNFNPVEVIEQTEIGWQITTPEVVLQTRLTGIADALARLLTPEAGETSLSRQVEQALPLVKQATEALPVAGRTLFAAHHILPWPDEPRLALWHGLNLLREYRGDGHIIALQAEGVSPIESLLFEAAYATRRTLAMLLQTRAWPETLVQAAQQRLDEQGLLKAGVLTEAGRTWRERVEQLTDKLDTAPFEALGQAQTEKLFALLEPLDQRILERGGLKR